MKVCDFLAVALLSCALICGIDSKALAASKPGDRVSWSYISKDKVFMLKLRMHARNFRYELRRVDSGGLLATANSAIRPIDVDQGHFRGTIDVCFAGDLNSLIIREDVSDASPSVRFIYFELLRGKFLVYYLLNPPIQRWSPEPIMFDFPHIKSIEGRKIVFVFPNTNKEEPVEVNSIQKTTVPTTAN